MAFTNRYRRYKMIFLSVSITLGIPVFFLVVLFTSSFNSVIEAIIYLLMIITYISLVFITGAWGWMGYYLRWLLVLLCIPAIIKVIVLYPDLPHLVHLDTSTVIDFILILLLGGLILQAFKGFTEPENTISLASPFKDGTYLIAQGGGVGIINRHFPHPSQKYAMDIVKINKWGYRAQGIYPSAKEDFYIWNEPVYSPCAGVVTAVSEHHEDFDPPEKDVKHPAGNYVTIHFESGTLYLAHLRQNTIAVSKGDMVEKGDLIGYIGNSGNSTEPHLHIHAEKNVSENSETKHIGLPIKIDGRFLKRNDICTSKVL